MTHEEFEKLVSDVIERCGDKFVLKNTCDSRTQDNASHFAQIESRFSKIDTTLSAISTKITWLVGILACIGIAIVGAVVSSILGG